MSNPDFSRPGAVDLSGLAPSAASQTASSPAGVSYVTDVTEQGFNQVVALSSQHPVILEFHSPRDTAGAVVSATLARLVNAAEGRFLLARVDVDAEARVAQSIGVQGVPTVVAVIGGQLAPLFQGVTPEDQISGLLDQVAQLAVANGITGRAQPMGQADGGEQTADAPADPRFEAADAALDRGDYAAAVQEFDKLLSQTPGDLEVIAGRAQAALLQRSTEFDPAVVVAKSSAEPGDVEVQLQAADLEMVQGVYDAAFDRLLGVMAELPSDERDQIRVRLLELFEVVGRTDPLVNSARRRLSSLLF